jgi:hypothetical protein
MDEIFVKDVSEILNNPERVKLLCHPFGILNSRVQYGTTLYPVVGVLTTTDNKKGGFIIRLFSYQTNFLLSKVQHTVYMFFRMHYC